MTPIANLIGNMIGAGIGDPTANTSPAAGGYTLSPDVALAHLNAYNAANPDDSGSGTVNSGNTEPYESVEEARANGENISDKPTYFSKDGTKLDPSTIKSPDDFLPMQKPSYWQKVFNQQASERAQQENAAYLTAPEITNQANRTRLGINANNLIAGRPALGQSPMNADPTAMAALTPDSTAVSQEGAYNAGLNMPIAPTMAAARQAQATADVPVAQAMGRNAIARNRYNDPELSAADEAVKYSTDFPVEQGIQRQAIAGNTMGTPEALAQATHTGAVTQEQQGKYQQAKLRDQFQLLPVEQRANLATAYRNAGMSEEELKVMGIDQDTLGKQSAYKNIQATYPSLFPYRTSSLTGNATEGYDFNPSSHMGGSRLAQKDMYGNFINDINNPMGSPEQPTGTLPNGKTFTAIGTHVGSQGVSPQAGNLIAPPRLQTPGDGSTEGVSDGGGKDTNDKIEAVKQGALVGMTDQQKKQFLGPALYNFIYSDNQQKAAKNILNNVGFGGQR
jgi:hypothetical protein